MKPFGDSGPPPQMNINLSECPDVVCSRCGRDLFMDAKIVKRLSPIQSPNHKVGIVPIPILVCVGCGTPLNMAQPMSRETFNERKEKQQ